MALVPHNRQERLARKEGEKLMENLSPQQAQALEVRKYSEIKTSLGIFPDLWNGASAGAGQQTVPSQFPNVPHSSPINDSPEDSAWNMGNAIQVFWLA